MAKEQVREAIREVVLLRPGEDPEVGWDRLWAAVSASAHGGVEAEIEVELDDEREGTITLRVLDDQIPRPDLP